MAIEDTIQKYAANSLVYMKLIRSLPALLVIIFCGAWSDSIGRKVPILFPFIGMLLSLMLYLISYATNMFSTLLAGGLLSGLFGEVGLILMAGYSFVTDVTEKEERTKYLGRLMAMSFIGQFFGSLLLAIIVKEAKAWHVFIIASVIAALSIVVIITFLQDSLHDKTRTVLLCRMTYLVETWQVITKPRQSKLRSYIIIILVCMAIHQACLWGEYDITMLYVRHRPLNWTASRYGFYLTMGYIVCALGTLFLLPLLNGFFKVSDFSLAMAAVGFKVIQVAWQAFALEDWMVYFCLPMMLVSSMFVPALKSMLSKLIDESEVGKIFGLSAFGETLSGLFGSLMFTALYGASVKIFPGLAFILEALFNVVLFGLVFWLSNSYKKHYHEFSAEDDGVEKDEQTMNKNYQYEEVKPAQSQNYYQESQEQEELNPNRNPEISITSYHTQHNQSDSDAADTEDERQSWRSRRCAEHDEYDDQPQNQPAYHY